MAERVLVLESSQRQQGVSPNLIYLDEAATSWPRAPGVVEAVTSALASPPGAGVGGIADDASLARECREQLARMLDAADSDRVILTTGASHALNLAIHGTRRLRRGGVIASCADHVAALIPLYRLQQAKRIHLHIIGLDETGQIDAAAFSAALDRTIRLVVLPHASHVMGRIFDVEPLLALAKSVGAQTLLNAAQTIGEVPVIPANLKADMVAVSGHKRLRGPPGTGALYVAPHISLAPSCVCGAGVRYRWGPSTQLLPADQGTAAAQPSAADLAGFRAALRWSRESAVSCREQGHRLASTLRRGLRRIPGVRLVGDAPRSPRLPIVAFTVAGRLPDEVVRDLARLGVYCAGGIHCAPLIHKALGTRPHGTVRLSLSGFNTEDQIQTTLRAVRQVAARTAA
jgi:cysteine desulfurase/selenocysteine lyase